MYWGLELTCHVIYETNKCFLESVILKFFSQNISFKYTIWKVVYFEKPIILLNSFNVSLGEVVWAHTTSVTPPLFIEVNCTKTGLGGVMYFC